MFQDHSIPVVAMTYLKRHQAIELLKRVLYLERKMEFVRGENLDDSNVINLWEKMNFVDNEAFAIARRLSKQRKLADVVKDMQKRLWVQDKAQDKNFI